MVLDLGDERLKGRLLFPDENRARLVIEWPGEEPYRTIVSQALRSLRDAARSEKAARSKNSAVPGGSVKACR